jgi:membrane protein YqaA with SNARE-associated domain
MNLAAHRHAITFLALVSFAESSFFLVPPDAMLIPMVLAVRERAWKIAAVCTVASVAGGLAGYGIGAYLFEALGRPVLELYNAMPRFEEISSDYNEHGVLIVFTAGFTVIPYKIFTIASGVTGMDPVAFALTSLVGRGLRFFIVAGLLWKFGDPIRGFIEKYLGVLFVAFCVLLAFVAAAIKFLF